MKKTLRWPGYLALAVVLICAAAWATGYDYLFRGLRATYLRGERTATIDDRKFFDQAPVPLAEPKPWPLAGNYNRVPISPRLRESLEKNETEAFLIFHKDSLIFEEYYLGRTDTVRSNSFSMAKTVVTLLAQIAVEQGYLKGWDQKVRELLPELGGPYADSLELWHLSTMSSGQEWTESYKNPFEVTARCYYGSDLKETILGIPITQPPGQSFAYKSGTTQLLALCIEQATGISLAEYASLFLWQPLGAERSASWHLDREGGDELAYCCLNATARDFARLGQLLLHHGRWEGMQLVDSAFVDRMRRPRFSQEYGWGVWIDYSHGEEMFYLRGVLGQYVMVFPALNLTVVRLGRHDERHSDGKHPDNVHLIEEEIISWAQNL